MSCYIIAYDLSNSNISDYNELIKAIQSYGTWAHISESVWAVSGSSLTAASIRDNLLKYFDKNSRLFVIKSGVEAAWKNCMCDNEWLKTNL